MQRWGDLNLPWSCRRGLFPPLPTFPTQGNPKRQQRGRPAVGTSVLAGLREEGRGKMSGQRPFTVMGFGLGQWVSSSY